MRELNLKQVNAVIKNGGYGKSLAGSFKYNVHNSEGYKVGFYTLRTKDC